MRGFKFNFITVFAFVLLVVYAYLAAMGLLYGYQDQGIRIEHAGAFFLAVIAIVSTCIYLMCRARATRWEKVGIPAQIALGVVIVVTFFFISKPFSSYVTVIGQKEQVYNEIDTVVSAAKDLNTAYINYANDRIDAYHPDESSTVRRDIRVNALRRQLLPPQLAVKQPDRNKWLDDISGMRLRNIQMPNNLANMEKCVKMWMQDYQKMSEVVFEDEIDVQAFQYATFSTNYANLRKHLGGYSIWALIVAIICSIFMLIPYFTTEQDMSLRTSNQKGMVEKIKSVFSGNKPDMPDENLEGEDYE